MASVRQKEYQEALTAGHALAWEGLWERAAAEYRRALTISPGEPSGLVFLALALERLGKPDEALAALGSAEALRDDPLLVKKRADLAAAAGQHAEATSTYLTAGELLWKRGRKQDAIGAWRLAAANTPELELAHQLLAEAYEDTGDVGSAAAERAILAELQPATAGQPAADAPSVPDAEPITPVVEPELLPQPSEAVVESVDAAPLVPEPEAPPSVPSPSWVEPPAPPVEYSAGPPEVEMAPAAETAEVDGEIVLELATIMDEPAEATEVSAEVEPPPLAAAEEVAHSTETEIDEAIPDRTAWEMPETRPQTPPPANDYVSGVAAAEPVRLEEEPAADATVTADQPVSTPSLEEGRAAAEATEPIVAVVEQGTVEEQPLEQGEPAAAGAHLVLPAEQPGGEVAEPRAEPERDSVEEPGRTYVPPTVEHERPPADLLRSWFRGRFSPRERPRPDTATAEQPSPEVAAAPLAPTPEETTAQAPELAESATQPAAEVPTGELPVAPISSEAAPDQVEPAAEEQTAMTSPEVEALWRLGEAQAEAEETTLTFGDEVSLPSEPPEAVTESPAKPAPPWQEAVELLRSGMVDDALSLQSRLLREVLAAGDGSAGSVVALARDLPNVDCYVVSALTTASTEELAPTLEGLARAALLGEVGLLAAAEQEYEELIVSAPECLAPQVGLARLLERRGQAEGARTKYAAAAAVCELRGQTELAEQLRALAGAA